jgi:hypothetical protein
MGIYEHADYFAGLKVKEFEKGGKLRTPEKYAWRIGFSWEDEGRSDVVALLESLLSATGADRIEALVIGSWAIYDGHGKDSSAAVKVLAKAAPKLPNLRAIFLGDITGEENEISWIEQSDVSPLLAAYPKLEEFRVRGSMGLELGTPKHDRLRSLIVECGGLPKRIAKSVAKGSLPALEHLELWIGDDGYGREVEAKDFAKILSGDLFPRLRHLGLRDAENADDIAAAVAKSALIKRIKSLDLSLGTLGDEGAQALLDSPTLAGGAVPMPKPAPAAKAKAKTKGTAKGKAAKSERSPQLPAAPAEGLTGREPALPRKHGFLEKLDIHHHFVSEELVERLRLTVGELDASDPLEARSWGDGEPYRYVAVGE